MPLFLVNWLDTSLRELHEHHIYRALRRDNRFESVDFQLADHRDPGPFRVIGHTKSHWFVSDESYPAEVARIEVGFDRAADGNYRYWINWIEPGRGLLVGWHRDDTHPDIGPVHMQINHRETVITRVPVSVLDGHPGDVLYQRLDQLSETLPSIEWDGEVVVGFRD